MIEKIKKKEFIKENFKSFYFKNIMSSSIGLLADYIADYNNDYDITDEKFGSYSMGEVRGAIRKSDNLHVAIKVIKMDMSDTYNLSSVMREIELLATIKHPKCIRLVGFNLYPCPIIITKYIPNGTLYNALQKKNKKLEGHEAFTSTKMMCSIYGICSAMDYLHSKGIMHRGLTPMDILLDENYDVRLGGFGLSRKNNPKRRMTVKVGAPLYMAPELIEGKYSNYTNTVDVFSFGVMYLQYFGELRNLDDNNGSIGSADNLMDRVTQGARFARPDGVTNKQWSIYTRCTDENPFFRPTFHQLTQLFELDESYWFEGVNKEEYMAYIKKCKKAI